VATQNVRMQQRVQGAVGSGWGPCCCCAAQHPAAEGARCKTIRKSGSSRFKGVYAYGTPAAVAEHSSLLLKTSMWQRRT
jgi:hypothetical protein